MDLRTQKLIEERIQRICRRNKWHTKMRKWRVARDRAKRMLNPAWMTGRDVTVTIGGSTAHWNSVGISFK